MRSGKDQDIYIMRDPNIEIGHGNWRWFPKDRLEDVFDAARDWKKIIGDIDKPWLCWCVDEDWCYTQQRLVSAAGWTPVVGTDGRISNPRMIKESVFVDFNKKLKLPTMWFDFPVEFQFLFCKKLAFWHSDFIPPMAVMNVIAPYFDNIEDGQYIGVRGKHGIRATLKCLINRKLPPKRWFEVIGCITAKASRSQYECGCGIWRQIAYHPNATGRVIKMNPYRDHGVGIWYWEKYFGGNAIELPVDYRRHHYSVTSFDTYKNINSLGIQSSVFYKHKELSANFDLKKITAGLGLPEASIKDEYV